MADTIVSNLSTLDAVRAAEDAPVASVHGYDVSSSLNALHEILLGDKAPGAGSITQLGHVHDHNGAGIGILRSVCGGFQIVGGPITHTSSAPAIYESLATTRSFSQYPTHAVGVGGFKMGVAYVSPGMSGIKILFQAKVDNATLQSVKFFNITDNLSSAVTGLTTNPAWYSVILPVTHPGGGALHRIDIDMYCIRDLVARTFYLYAAFPYEYINGAP